MLPTPDDVTIIRRTPLFSALDEAQATALLRGARVRDYADESLLFSAGDRADHFYVVLRGSVRLFALSEEGDETIIEVIGAGNSFAEGAIFGAGRYPVHAEVFSGARLVSINAAPLLEALRSDSGMAMAVLASLCRWQLNLMAEIRRLKAQAPAQRLAWFLVSLAGDVSGEAVFRLPFRKTIVAGRIGITPESLSRALARLAELGVETKGDIVTVHDVEALRAFCRG